MIPLITIAIDGPVGVGKSSVARSLADRLGYLYIDSGAMYRAVTLSAMRGGIALDDFAAVAAHADTLDIELVPTEDGVVVLCNGEDVTLEIRTPEVSRGTSPVADNPAVRARLVALQQKMGAGGGVVMEGRDIGTIVFPKAELKFYLDAEPEVRAEPADQEEVLRDLLVRDCRDQGRPVGALRVADGAIIIDTSDLTAEEVVETLHQRSGKYLRLA